MGVDVDQVLIVSPRQIFITIALKYDLTVPHIDADLDFTHLQSEELVKFRFTFSCGKMSRIALRQSIIFHWLGRTSRATGSWLRNSRAAASRD